MPFNSFPFLFVFLPFTMLGWWAAARKPLHRVVFIVLMSYVFYGLFDFPRGFFLLPGVLFATLFNFGIARWMSRPGWESRRGLILWLGVGVDLGVLGYFKYLGFFEGIVNSLFHLTGRGDAVSVHHVLLPLGISFYTFNSMSYIIDVYRRKIAAEDDLVRFAAFIALFPYLLVGPIVRYADMKEQLKAPPVRLEPAAAATGVYFIVCGLFKKVVIADMLSPLVADLLARPERLGLISGWAAVVGYSLQMYFDFSGYSEIAYGAAALLGFRFPQNFNSPYKAANIAEFWQRWHMTLSAWFRDYVFEPLMWTLTKRRGMQFWFSSMLVSTVATMALCGFWHGAGWVFLFYGLGHGVLIGIGNVARKYRVDLRSEAAARALTYGGVLLLFVVFVSPDVHATRVTLQALCGGNGLGRVSFEFLSMSFWKWAAAPFFAAEGSVSALYLAAVAGLLAFVNLAPNAYEFRFKNPWAGGCVQGLQMALCLLFLSRARPFLYLQF